jgi:hypothetical protein
VKLKITDVSSGFSDETVVRFLPSATEAHDRSVDALKLISPNRVVPSLFSMSTDELCLSINSLPETSGTTYTNIYLLHVQSSSFVLDLFYPVNGIPANERIYLEDVDNACYYIGNSDFPVTVSRISSSGEQPAYKLIVIRSNGEIPPLKPCIVAGQSEVQNQ